MPVALLPPVSGSGGEWSGQMPLTAARRYARGRLNSRWHRIRSGMQWPTGRISLSYWCGVQGSDSPSADGLWTADDLPAGESACGTCVGRALGAHQDEAPVGLPPLRFDPRWQVPPKFCPGSRDRDMWTSLGRSNSAGICLACGDAVAIRVVGRGYDAWGAGPIFHAPGEGLVEPCPFHAWQRLRLRGDRVACGCGWPYPQPAVAS